MRTRWLLVLLFGSLAACESDSTPTEPWPEPPPDTGLVSADLRGTWVVTEVMVVAQTGGLGPFPPGTGMAPPAEGARIVIDDRGVASLDGVAGDRTACGTGQRMSVPVFVNQVDDRFVVFDRMCQTVSDPSLADSGGSFRLSCAFGTLDVNRMLGETSFRSIGFVQIPEMPSSGVYRVVLEREQ